MNSELRFYLSVVWRRLPILLVVFLTVSFTAFAVAVVLPTVYTARGQLLVEAPQIPVSLAQSTVQVRSREQLAVIQRRLLTRANLLQIAREFDVYENMDTMSPDEIVTQMRADTRISASGSNSAATVMEVQFSARTGAIAAGVANEYITRILAENANTRQERAEGTLEFFQLEVERLERELQARNEQILEFQKANADALPDTLNYRLNRQEILQQRISQIDRDRSILADQRDRLVDLQNRGIEFVRPEDDVPRTQLEQQLAQLRNQLTNARAIYSPDSPRVTVLSARIAALEELQEEEARAAAEQALVPLSGDPTADLDPPTAIELQIDEIDIRLRFLAEQEALIDAELAELEDTLVRTPANAIALEGLRRDYANIERQYSSALDRLSTAATGERIEVMSKGERISVIEQARAPDEPSDPNRPMIAATGLAAGAGLAVALFAALEVMNKAVRRPVDLAHHLGITPIATVHYIVTPGERLRRRLAILLVGLAILILVPAALYYVHYQIRPLDLLWQRFLEEFRF